MPPGAIGKINRSLASRVKVMGGGVAEVSRAVGEREEERLYRRRKNGWFGGGGTVQ